jgi:hypothetical protein
MLEAMRTGKKGYAEGGLVGKVSDIISRKNKSSSILDYNTYGKNISDFSNITKALTSMGFLPSGKTLGNSKSGFEHLYKNSSGIIIDAILDPKKVGIADFIFNNLPKTSKGDNDSKVRKYIKTDAYTSGAEIFDGKKDIFGGSTSNGNSIGSGSSSNNTNTSTKSNTSNNSSSNSQASTSTQNVKTENKELDTIISINKEKEDGTVLTEKQKNKLQAIYEVMQEMYEEEVKNKELLQTVATSNNEALKSILERNKANSEYTSQIRDLATYKERMYNTDNENMDYELSKNKESLQLLQDKYDSIDSTNKGLTDTYRSTRDSELSRLTATKEFSKLSIEDQDRTKDNFKLMTEQAVIRMNTLSYQEKVNLLKEIELTTMKNQSTELDTQYKKHSAITSSVMSYIEAIASGKGMSFDISQVSEGATKSFTKVASGGTANSSDYLNMSAYAMGIVDQITDANLATQQKSLDWEQQILSLRLQGARTESEKLAIEKQQYELQVQALDLAYQQQTSFMGISGSTGTALSGALSGATTGMVLGGPVGAAIGGGLGLISGYFEGETAKAQLALQKEQLETQQDIADYNEEMSDELKSMNSILSDMASLGGKIGIQNALNSVINSIQTNPNAYTLGGTGSTDWTMYTKDNPWYKSAHYSASTQSETATYSLSDFGYTTDDLNSLSDYQSLLSAVNTELSSVTSATAYWNSINSYGTDSSSNYASEVLAEYQAQIEALGVMADNIETIINLMSTMASVTLQSSFGATLKEVYAEDGTTVESYVSNWDDFMATTFTNAYTDATSNILKNATSITSGLFSGLTNIFIQNYSSMTALTTKLEALYTSLSDSLTTGLLNSETALDTTAVTTAIQEMITLASEYNTQQTAINTVTDEFMQLWIDNGGDISDIYDSLTAGAKSVYDSMSDALGTTDYSDLLSGLATSIGTNFTDALKTSILNSSSMTSVMTELYSQMSTSVADLTVSSASDLFSAISSASVQLASESAKLEAISSIFDSSSIDYYNNDGTTIKYQTGTTSTNSYSYSITNKVEPNYLFTSSSEEVYDLCELIGDSVINVLKERGALN